VAELITTSEQRKMLSVDQLCWSPAADMSLLQSVSVELSEGDVLGVIGPNGSGKSSFLRCLYREHQPDSGTVMLAGRELGCYRPAELARKVAVVLQEDLLPDFSIRVEQLIGLGRLPYQSGWSADTASHHPLVIETAELLDIGHLLQRSYRELSGGERKRVQLARALVQQPELLILDEPTNHLDIRHQLTLLQLLRDLPVTVVVTLHDLNHALQYCDQLLLLEQGRVVASGAAAQVLKSELVDQVYRVRSHQLKSEQLAHPVLAFSTACSVSDLK